jgi:hypothetical protein
LSETFLILRRIQRDIIINYIGLHVKYRYCYQILMKLVCSRLIFEKSSNIKLHENPSSGSRVVPCGQTDMTKLRVACRNFANAPKNGVPFDEFPATNTLALCPSPLHVISTFRMSSMSCIRIAGQCEQPIPFPLFFCHTSFRKRFSPPRFVSKLATTF